MPSQVLLGICPLDTGSSVRYRLVGAMQLGKVTITTPRLTSWGWVTERGILGI
jgi:hypothetical protein